MKKKLVLFTLILGLLLPVFGATVSATRTKDEWHETDAAAVKEIEDDATYKQAMKDFEERTEGVNRAEKVIKDWQDAIDYKEGTRLDADEALEAYNKAKEDLEGAKSSYNSANEAAEKAHEDYLAMDDPATDGQIADLKADLETLEGQLTTATQKSKELKDALDKVTTEYNTAKDNYYASGSAYLKAREGKDEDAELEAWNKFASQARALGFADADIDPRHMSEKLSSYKEGTKDPTADSILARLAEAESTYKNYNVDVLAKAQKDRNDKYAELERAKLSQKAGLAEKQAALKKYTEAANKRDEAEAAIKDAEKALRTAEKNLQGAQDAVDGAKDSAEQKLNEAIDAAKKEFAGFIEKDPLTQFTFKVAQGYLKQRQDYLDELLVSDRYKDSVRKHEEAVFLANNRPDTISGLTATANSDGTVTLNWDAVDADFIKVFYLGTNGKTKDLLARLDGNVTSYTDADPELNANNFYAAVAVDWVPANDYIKGNALSGYQVEKEVEEIGWTYAYAEVTDRPGDITNLKATTDEDGYVTISWDAAEGADYYRLFSLGTDGKSQDMIYEGPATTFQDKDAVATIDDEYVWNFYTVNAIKVQIDKDNNKTEFFNKNTYPTYTFTWADGSLRGKDKPAVGELEAIKNMTATTNADGTITVSWSEDPNAFYYIVVYISRTDANGENNVNVQTWKSVSGDTSATFDELAEGYHFFRVYGVNKIDGEYRQSPPADPNYTFSFTAGTEIAD